MKPLDCEPNLSLIEENKQLKQRLAELEAENKSLLQYKQRYNFLFDNPKILLSYFDTKKEIRDVSVGFVTLFNEKRENIIGKSIFEYIHKDDVEEFESKLSDLSIQNPQATFQHRLSLPCGKIIWVDRTLIAGYNQNNVNTGIISQSIDITEQKLKDKLFADLFKLETVGITISNNTKEWIEVNDSFCKMLGYTRNEIEKNNWEKLTHPDDIKKDLDKYDELLKGKIENYTLEKRLIKKNREILHAIISVICIRDFQGNAENIYCLYQDISEQKRMDAERNENLTLFRTISSNALEGIAIHEKGIIKFVNKTILRLTGFTKGEVKGRFIENFIVLKENEKIEKVRKNKKKPYEVRILKKDYTWFYAQIVEKRVKTIHGVSRIVFIKNLTYQRNLEFERNQLRMLIDNLPGYICIKDSQGNYIEANRNLASLGKIPVKEIKGKSDYDIFPKHLADEYREIDIQIISEKEGKQIEEKSVDSQHNPITVLTTKTPIRDKEGNTRLVCSSVDISELNRLSELEKKHITERNQLRTLIDLIPDLIYIKDKESKFINVNSALVELHKQKSYEDLIGKSDADFDGEENTKQYYDDDQYVINTGLSIIDKLETGKDKEENQRMLSTTKVPFRDKNGEIAGLVGITRDITKQVENVSILDLTIPFCIIGLDKTIISTNKAFRELFNYNDAKENKCFDIIKCESEKCTNCMLEILRLGSRDRIEFEHHFGEKYYRVTALARRDVKGNLIEIIENYIDISDKIQLRTLIDNIPDFIYFKDTNSRFIDANISVAEVMCKIADIIIPVEYKNEPYKLLLGKTDHDFYAKEYADKYLADEQKVINTKEKEEIDELGLDEDKKERRKLTTKVPLLNKKGEVTGIIGIGRDITELINAKKEAETATQEAKSANKVKTDFLGNLSHEIRTPLTNIIGFSDILRKKITDSKQLEHINKISANSHMLLLLISDIINYAQLDAKEARLKPEPVDLVSIAEEIAKYFSSNIEHKKLYYKQIIADSIPESLLLDKPKFMQILLNVIGNAIRYTNLGGVTFSILYQFALKKLVNLEIKIIDTGIGINEEDQLKIYEPFYQSTQAEIKTRVGVGLGLSVTKKYVEMMNGRIELESKVGIGSTFTIFLPNVEILDVQADNSDKNNIKFFKEKFNPARILVVDDEKSIFIIFKSKFKKTPIKILGASDGEKAVSNVKEVIPDLIFMDIEMPKKGGIEASQEIKLLNKDIIIIAYTASVTKRTIIENAPDLFDDIIIKPMNDITLLNVLKKCRICENTEILNFENLTYWEERDLAKLAKLIRNEEAIYKLVIEDYHNQWKKIKNTMIQSKIHNFGKEIEDFGKKISNMTIEKYGNILNSSLASDARVHFEKFVSIINFLNKLLQWTKT